MIYTVFNHFAGTRELLLAIFAQETEDLKEFSTWLKTRLSTGGSIKDGAIIIQGDQREAVLSLIEQRKQQESNR